MLENWTEDCTDDFVDPDECEHPTESIVAIVKCYVDGSRVFTAACRKCAAELAESEPHAARAEPA